MSWEVGGEYLRDVLDLREVDEAETRQWNKSKTENLLD